MHNHRTNAKNIKIEEAAKLHELTKAEETRYDRAIESRHYESIKGNVNRYDRDMEVKYWTHPAKFIKIIDGQGDSKQTTHACTDGSKGENGVGSGIAVYRENKLTATLKCKLNWQCSNNQAEQLAIL